MEWRCPRCHDVMKRGYQRRFHLQMCWLQRQMARLELWGTPILARKDNDDR